MKTGKRSRKAVYITIFAALAVSLVLHGYQFYLTKSVESRLIYAEQHVNAQIQELDSEHKEILTQSKNQVDEELDALNIQLYNSERSINQSLSILASNIDELKLDIEDVESSGQQSVEELQSRLSNLNVSSTSFQAVIEKVLPGVVSVTSFKSNAGKYIKTYGSGFVIDEEGFVVTNNHVILDAQSVTVDTYDGKSYPAQVVARKTDMDLALLRIPVIIEEDLAFGDSSLVRAGDKVVALGNPGGLDFSATEGIVSNPSRPGYGQTTYIQIDTPINPGNSGGPLVNTEGKVIGITTAKVSGFEGVGFAIASDSVKGFVYGEISRFSTD